LNRITRSTDCNSRHSTVNALSKVSYDRYDTFVYRVTQSFEMRSMTIIIVIGLLFVNILYCILYKLAHRLTSKDDFKTLATNDYASIS